MNTSIKKRRVLTLGTALGLSLLTFGQCAWAATNTALTVNNGATNLNAAATYTPATVPTANYDVEFTGAYSPAAFTLATNGTFGSLDDLASTPITISNTGGTAPSLLTLGGAGGRNSVPGTNAADLLYTDNGAGANLTISAGSGNTALGLVLGQSGSFDNGGTLSISSPIGGTGSLTVNETSAASPATLSGALNFTGNLILSNNNSGNNEIVISGPVNNVGTIVNSGTGISGQIVNTYVLNNIPGASLITGAISNSVTGVYENSATSDLFLGGASGAYTGGINIQQGTLLFNSKSTDLGASTDVVTLGNAASPTNATILYGATIDGGAGTANQAYANPISVVGSGTNTMTVGDYSVTFSGPVTLKNSNLNTGTVNVGGGSAIYYTGGITGTGNIDVSIDTTSGQTGMVNSFAQFNTHAVNNVGSISFDNASIVGGVTSGLASGTNQITGGVGPNVTAIYNNGSNPLSISTTGITVNSAGTTLGDNGSALFTVSSAITGTGNLIIDNNTGTANAIVFSGTAISNNGAVINAGSGTGGTILNVPINNPAASLVQNSANGQLTLNASNSYTGTTTVQAGVADFTQENALYGNNNSLWTASKIIVQTGGTIAFEVGNTGGFTTADIAKLGSIGGSGTSGFEPGSSLGIDTTPGNVSLTSALTNSNLGLVVLGTNTLTLVGNNTYTGPTTITAGALLISGSGQLNSGNYAGAIALGTNTGSAFTFNSTASQILSGVISGAGGLTAQGGSLTLSNSNTFTGQTTLASGTLDVANPLALQNSAVQLTAGTLIFDKSASSTSFTFGSLAGGINFALQTNASSPLPVNLSEGGNNASTTYSGVLSGTGSLTKNGSGALALTGANTYTGPTVVNGGILDLNNTGAILGKTSSITVNSGASIRFDKNQSESGWVGNAIISGSGGIIENVNNPSQAITLDRANTYTGPTSLPIRGGFIVGVASTYDVNGNQTSGAFGVNSAISMTAGNLILFLNGNNNQVGSLSGNNGDVVLGSSAGRAAAVFTIGGDNTSQSFSGLISDTNSSGNSTGNSAVTTGGQVVKIGTGTQALNAANTYAGATTITGGVLSIAVIANGGAASGIGQSSNAASNLIIDNATLQYTGTGGTTDRLFQVGRSTDTGPVTVSLDASDSGPVTFTNTGSIPYGLANKADTINFTGVTTAANTFYPVIANNGSAAVNVTETGAGSWTLASTETYTGPTSIPGGTLGLSGTLSGTPSVVTSVGGAFSEATTGVLKGAGVTFTQGSTATSSIAGLNTYTGVTSVTAGTLNLSGTLNGTPSVVTSGVGTFSEASTGVIAGTGVTFIQGSNAPFSPSILSGANTYTGATLINAGIINANAPDGSGFGALGNGGNITFGGGTLQYGAGAASTDYSTRIVNSTSAISIDTAGAEITFAGALASSNTGGLTVQDSIGGGQLVLTGANAYVGPTTVEDSGYIFDYSATGAIPVASTLVIGGTDNSGGTFDLTGYNQTVSGLVSQGSAGSSNLVENSIASANPSILTISGSGGTFSGQIGDSFSGQIGLTVASGVETLSGNNGYSGPTTITGGALIVTGSLSGSAYGYGDTAVNVTGGTLGGNGLIVIGGSSNFTVSNGGRLAPGLSQSGLTVDADSGDTGSVNLQTGSIFRLFINNSNAAIQGAAALADYSKLTLGSSVSATLAGSISINKGTVNNGDLFTVIILSGQQVSGTFSNSTLVSGDTYTFSANGQTWLINYDYDGSLGETAAGVNTAAFESITGGDEVALLAVVPEPGTWAMMLAGAGLLMVFRARRSAA